MDVVQEQYEKFPYPSIPWTGRIVTTSLAHACYEAGAALVHQRFISSSEKTLALLGCGTLEPYAFGLTHKNAHIRAVDFSSQSLTLAQRKCRLSRIKNVQFFNQDLLKWADENKESIDYVHCYGVIHHLAEPQSGFDAVRKVLKKDGFARIMVYSQSNRRRIKQFQRIANILNVTSASKNQYKNLKNFALCLPSDHPMRKTFLSHSEKSFTSGLIDAFLHTREASFTYETFLKNLRSAGLIIYGWDFSETTKSFLDKAWGKNFEEKILWLEAFDQFPSPFTVWVGPLIQMRINRPLDFVTANPLVDYRFKRTIYSTLLKRKIKLTSYHKKILKASQEKLLRRSELKEDIVDLVESRFLLEVSQ